MKVLTEEEEGVIKGNESVIVLVLAKLEEEILKRREEIDKFTPYKLVYYNDEAREIVKEKVIKYKGQTELLKEFSKIFNKFII